MSEFILNGSSSPFNCLIDNGFGISTTFYSYLVLTPIDGETLVTPIFYLNGSETMVHLEINWKSDMIRVRLVTEYELFDTKPHITKITISQDNRKNKQMHIFNRKYMDEKWWMEFKRPKFDEPKFLEFLFSFIYDERRRTINSIISRKMDLYERLNKLYKDKTYADLKIRVGEVEFLAHKAILAAKSPVFADMFNHITNAESDNVIIINDIDPKIFEIFLKYLYLSEIDHIPRTNTNYFLHLIQISIIYKVDDFTLAMSKLAMNSLTPENLQKWLIYGVDLNLEYIQGVTTSCIRNCTNSGVPYLSKFNNNNIL
ncbi:PREDICTED: uncharacterized protein LOC106791928 [Polistes canadensis]|uniref:uncharacterized protein LOC106791928 n=1 Tax=Polistes canadensis TaxID=91411 RepID=UPI0007190219|nr:PREDICTED: uncharacterized protein LOC106791928 [Polistes canadensis]